ncbi:hypothetical protein [Deinococcus hohokamensis]|uniref:Uncharacterized protein n=1 Tax=Deinococcus hohokamensis TaxID=309883 RepID=A0ABV9I844_9DEIO
MTDLHLPGPSGLARLRDLKDDPVPQRILGDDAFDLRFSEERGGPTACMPIPTGSKP